MKTLDAIAKTILAEKENLRKRFNVSEVGIFGSYVRGEQNEKSDIDILVDFAGKVTLFDLIDLEDYLDAKLETKVDLVLKRALKPHIGERVLKEVIYL